MISYKTFERNYKLSKVFDGVSYIDPEYKELIDDLIDISENGSVICSNGKGITIPDITYSYVYNNEERFHYCKINNERTFIYTTHLTKRLFHSHRISDYHIHSFINDFIINFIDYDKKESQMVKCFQ
jgi:hypothetical protein